MRRAYLPEAVALRPADRARPLTLADDDAGGLRAPVSGNGRGALWPGVARLEGNVSPAGFAQPHPGPVPGGWQHAPGAGRANGRAVGLPGGSERAGRRVAAARFDNPVAGGGYAWWYLDALSDDGEHALTIIAFIGSVFSPYYAWARQRDPAADPLQHCALNVALYGRSGHRWTMTERSRERVSRSADALCIGPSTLVWEGDALVLRIDEVTAPWPSRIRGVVRLHPAAPVGCEYLLDAAGRHRWSPIAPCARVEVQLSQPALCWRGTGYLDSNAGDRPLEADFKRWDWSRASLPGSRSAVLYDLARRGGDALSLAMQFDAQGRVYHFAPPPAAALSASAWRVARGTRSDAGSTPRTLQRLEDGPFYARSVISAQWLGEPVTAMHESLSLSRFDSSWVRLMLPFRMPRRAG